MCRTLEFENENFGREALMWEAYHILRKWPSDKINYKMRRTIVSYYNRDKDIRKKMLADICFNCEVAPTTAYAWLKMERNPRGQNRAYIKRLVKKYFNENVPVEELFNNSHVCGHRQ